MGIHNYNHLIDRLILSPCSKLRELEYQVTGGQSWDCQWQFLSSITSTNIEKITIKSITYPSLKDDLREKFDNILTELKKLQGRKQGLALKVIFKGHWVQRGSGLDILLPNFVREGGEVTLTYSRRK